MTDAELVSEMAEAHVELDAALTKARKASQRIEHLSEVGAGGGLARALKAKEMIHAGRKLTGMIADVGYFSAHLHQEHTKIARDNDIDAGSLTVVAGVTLPEIGTFGGGDR